MTLLRALIRRLMVLWAAPLRALLRAAARLFWRDREVTVRVFGRDIMTRSADRFLALLLLKSGLWEKEELDTIRKTLKPGMTAVDLGANIGVHTMVMAELVGGQGRVYAFEPDPDNFALLLRNVEKNGAANVECRRLAVSETTGETRLFRSAEHHGDHRLYDSRDGRPSIIVKTSRLDDALPANTRADFIKMDIQGAELLALRGMTDILRRSPHVAILCEYSPDLLRLAGCRPEDFLAECSRLGFSARPLSPDSGRQDGGETNLLLTRK